MLTDAEPLSSLWGMDPTIGAPTAPSSPTRRPYIPGVSHPPVGVHQRAPSPPIAPPKYARAELVRTGRVLAYATLGIVTLEAGVALTAGLLAGSVALWGYGADSVIEWASAATALWRLAQDGHVAGRARAERVSRRMIGVAFLALAVIVSADATVSLARRQVPTASALGIAIALLSLLSMPLLGRAKRRVARALASDALAADAGQTALCAYLSAILLGGLALNALFGWWWADPVSALVMVPIIAREGLHGVRGEAACPDECCS
jgi:divalent metal cation (Fe/Co/Zn/Cd) transporter